MNEIMINNAPVQVKEYNGVRVVTLEDIDTVHGRTDGTAGRNFRNNRDRFVEGEDYFKVCADEIRRDKIFDISNKVHNDVILITESGYLMLVKSFTDDLAWSVQRQLVNCYFKVKQETNLPNMSVMEMIAHIANNAVETEKRLTAIEATQEEQKAYLDRVTDAFEINPKTWRQEANKLVKKIASDKGLTFQHVWVDSYKALESEQARSGKKTYLIKMIDALGGCKWEYNFDDNAPNLPEARAERTPYISAIYSEASNDEIAEYKKNSELAKKESAVKCEKSEGLSDFGYVIK